MACQLTKNNMRTKNRTASSVFTPNGQKTRLDTNQSMLQMHLWTLLADEAQQFNGHLVGRMHAQSNKTAYVLFLEQRVDTPTTVAF